jgi:hypothetical protein
MAKDEVRWCLRDVGADGFSTSTIGRHTPRSVAGLAVRRLIRRCRSCAEPGTDRFGPDRLSIRKHPGSAIWRCRVDLGDAWATSIEGVPGHRERYGLLRRHAAMAAMVPAGVYRIAGIVAVWWSSAGDLHVLSPCGRCRGVSMRQIDEEICRSRRCWA